MRTCRSQSNSLSFKSPNRTLHGDPALRMSTSSWPNAWMQLATMRLLSSGGEEVWCGVCGVVCVWCGVVWCVCGVVCAWCVRCGVLGVDCVCVCMKLNMSESSLHYDHMSQPTSHRHIALEHLDLVRSFVWKYIKQEVTGNIAPLSYIITHDTFHTHGTSHNTHTTHITHPISHTPRPPPSRGPRGVPQGRVSHFSSHTPTPTPRQCLN
jgi:hypothetical protein